MHIAYCILHMHILIYIYAINTILLISLHCMPMLTMALISPYHLVPR